MTHILPDRISRTLVPGGVIFRLLGRQYVDKPTPEGIKFVGILDVPVQGCGVKLCQQKNPVESGIKTIADRDIDQAVFASKRYSRFTPIFGQRIEACATTAPHDYSQYFASHFGLGKCAARFSLKYALKKIIFKVFPESWRR